jgi:quinoprotein glucose dehydrogenase
VRASRVFAVAGVLTGTLLTVLSAAAQTGATGGEWRYYGADNGATRYSPLDGIDRSNVGDLEIAWRWSARNHGPAPEPRSQTTPIMVDGVLYFTAGSRRNVVAADAATGETLWMWRIDEGRRWEEAPRRNSGRGVAWWSDGNGDDRILVATPGFQLVALDAATGRPVDEFGAGGIVDLMADIRERAGVDPVGAIGNSSPPVVIGDVVIVGPAFLVGFRPESRANIPGDIRGYDVRTGELLWTFHTIPEPGEFGHDTWENEAWSFTGNAGVWTPFTADEELGYVYLPVEAATSDLSGGDRPGDNLFTSTLVCLDARTGERVWHFQIIHHDIWDYDIGSPPMLVDLTVDGRTVRAVAQLTKQGYVYTFNRLTGEPIWPVVERPVPQTDVPGEWTAPTQPFPTRPPAFARQGVTEDDLIDFTPDLRAEALEVTRSMRFGPLYTPPSLADAPDGTRGTLMLPGAPGSIAWESGAFDVETGILYVGTSHAPTLLSLVQEPNFSDLLYIAGDTRVPQIRGLPLIRPPYGELTAIDMNRGEILWQVPNGDTPEAIADHPDLQGLDIGRTGKPTRAGVLATRTLLFAGEGAGGAPVFRAHDKATGEIVWEMDLPGTQIGLPMTYDVDGRQFIVISVAAPGQAPELVALAVP